MRVGDGLRQNRNQAIIKPHCAISLPPRPVEAPISWRAFLRKGQVLNHPEIGQGLTEFLPH
jgi:hypothetical protein